VPAARLRSALIDFGSHRPELWPNLDPTLYELHAQGDTWADVTEGSRFAGGIWERSRYDWSDPDVVRLTVIDSNAFAPGSTWTYRLRRDGEQTIVDLEVLRRGRNLRGRLLTGLLRVGGGRVFCTDLHKALAALSAA
jgi:hypothetical protein